MNRIPKQKHASFKYYKYIFLWKKVIFEKDTISNILMLWTLDKAKKKTKYLKKKESNFSSEYNTNLKKKNHKIHLAYCKTVLKYSSENKPSNFVVPLNNYKEYTNVKFLNCTSIKVGRLSPTLRWIFFGILFLHFTYLLPTFYQK